MRFGGQCGLTVPVPITGSEKVGAHRKAKRRRGLCGHIGCRVASGDDYYCEEHRRGHSARVTAERAKHREAGLCAECREASGEDFYCLRHKKAQRARYESKDGE